MKPHILHILSLLIVAGLSSCNDDFQLPAGLDGEQKEYSLELSIDEGAISRGVSTIDGIGLKSSWSKGDKVTMTIDGGSSYTFTIENTSDITEGGRLAIFKYRGSIPTDNRVSGTIRYIADTYTESELDPDGRLANGYITSGDNLNILKILVYPHEYQKNNNDASHLKNVDNPSATFSDIDLTKSNKFSLQRNFAVVKIVLDDIYYPIYGGSILLVDGLGDTKRRMTLGKNDLLVDNSYQLLGSDGKSYYGYSTVNRPTNSSWTFYDVSSTKRPFTDYAVRDESKKLVAYMVLTEDCEIPEGRVITIGLRDQWSLDWYFWRTVPLRAKKFSMGGFYTLDLTQRRGGKYEYESTVGIYCAAGTSNTNIIGHIATKNIGAKSYTDPGNYYMHGYGQPVSPDGYYPSYPNVTPYYFYYEVGSQSYMKLDTPSGSSTTGGLFQFGTPSKYTGGNYIGALSHKIRFNGGHNYHPGQWWREWVEELKDMPTLFPEVTTYASPKWAPGPNIQMAASTFDNKLFEKMELIGSDGLINAENPVGVRVTVKRTKHTIFIPVSGIYAPTEVNSSHQIPAEATAQIIPGTEKLAAMTGYWLYMKPFTTPDEKAVQTVTYYFDAANAGQAGFTYNDLNISVPIRPMFLERSGGADVSYTFHYLLNQYFNYYP